LNYNWWLLFGFISPTFYEQFLSISFRQENRNCNSRKALKKLFRMKKLFIKCWCNWHLFGKFFEPGAKASGFAKCQKMHCRFPSLFDVDTFYQTTANNKRALYEKNSHFNDIMKPIKIAPMRGKDNKYWIFFTGHPITKIED